MVPFVEFGGPCVAGDADGCDDENLLGFEAVADEVVDGGEGGDCFPHAHSQKYRRFWVVDDELDCVVLIVMRIEFHG